MLKKIIIISAVFCSLTLIACSHNPTQLATAKSMHQNSSRMPSGLRGFINRIKNKFRRPVLELTEVGTNHAHFVIHKSNLKKFKHYEYRRYSWNNSRKNWVLDKTLNIPFTGDEIKHSDPDLRPGVQYLFRVQAKKNDSKLSKGLIITTHSKPGSTEYMPTGIGIQFNDLDNNSESLMTVEVGGEKQLCKLNSDHQFNVVKLPSHTYQRLVSQHPKFLTSKNHPNPYNPECQYTLVKGRRYNVEVRGDNGETDQVMRTLIYLGAETLSGSRGGVVCADGKGGAQKNGRTSIPHYYMLRYWSNTEDMDDSEITKCTNELLEKYGAKDLLDYELTE